MPQYLLASYLPDDFDPSTMTEEAVEAIHALNREITAAGAERFACGLAPASNAKTLRAQPNGKVSVTDGPFAETKEALAGFYMIEARDLNEAIQIASRIPPAQIGSIEVRPIRPIRENPRPVRKP
jgi:hypothetical protein